MTIIIGIKCIRGILIGSDSRTIYPDGHVDDDAHKLHVAEFEDGNSAIIAEAGNAEFSAQAVEMILESAKTKRLTDYRTVAECAINAVSALKQRQRDQYKGTAEELQKHFENYAFELMLTYYWQDEPYIFTLNFVTGLATKQDKDYCAIGCGNVLADFLISRIDLSLFGTGQGMWTIAYAIEEIKRFDSRCGGRTRAALVTSSDGCSNAMLYEDHSMQEAINEAIAFSNESKENWSDTARQRMEMIFARKQKKP